MIKEILDVRTGKREQVGGSGGSTELKLVATGSYVSNSESSIEYVLDNELKQGSVYLIHIYEDVIGSYSTYYIMGREGEVIPIFVANSDDMRVMGSLFIGEYHTTNKFNRVVISTLGSSPIGVSQDNIIEFYELPFTIGGAE